MRLESFFEKFDLFLGAPNAVVRMRELVLQLAVQGKLVLQDPRDESAEDCLSRLGLESTAGSLNGSGATDESLPPLWIKVRFEDVSVVTGGVTLGRKLGNRKVVSLPYLRVANVKRGEIDLGIIKEVSIPEDEIARYALRANDLLMTEGGDWDKVGRAAIWHGQIPVCLHQNHVFRARMRSPEFMPIWFERYFNSPDGRSYFESASKQTTNLASINMRQVRDCIVPFPPLAEQHRIVAKVNELMALCDRLEQQQQDRQTRHAALSRAALARFAEAPTRANLNFIFHKSYDIASADLRKSILTLAVQGKLVPQDPSDKPVNGLESVKRTQPIAEKEIPFYVPDSWQWSRLGCVSKLINGDRGKNYPNKAEYVPSGVPFINTGHIEPDGTLSMERMHYITRAKFDSLRSGKVQKGDLVYCLRGALGKTAIVSQVNEGAVASSLVIIRLSEKMIPRYAYFFLISPLGRELIRRFDNGSAQPNLSANSVNRYVTPLPPLAEQRRIVAKVDQLMALVDQLETQLATSHTTAAKLLDALVAELTAKA